MQGWVASQNVLSRVIHACHEECGDENLERKERKSDGRRIRGLGVWRTDSIAVGLACMTEWVCGPRWWNKIVVILWKWATREKTRQAGAVGLMYFCEKAHLLLDYFCQVCRLFENHILSFAVHLCCSGYWDFSDLYKFWSGYPTSTDVISLLPLWLYTFSLMYTKEAWSLRHIFLLKNDRGWSCWLSMTPMATTKASVSIMKGNVKSERRRVVNLDICSLSLVKAWWASNVHVNFW